MESKTAELTTGLAALREQHEAARLECEILEYRALQKTLDESVRRVTEAAWERVDRREYLYDDPSFGFPTGPISLLDDRLDGRDRQVFETELDLAVIRGTGRLLVGEFPTAWNVVELLTNYTVGSGTTWSAEADSGDAPPALVEAAQKVLDTFLDDNDWPGDYEREIIRRVTEDGESFTAIRPNGWRASVEAIEPPAVTEPAHKRDLEDWLGVSERFASTWSFGVHAPAGKSRPLGYHVVYDNVGQNWDYYPSESLSIARHCRSGLMEHIKAPGTLRNVKRGVSQFYHVVESLQHADKLLNNSAIGATIQAAIAYIVEHVQGVTKDAAAAAIAARATQQITRDTPLGQRTVHAQKQIAGKVVHTPSGTQYKPAPLGSSNAPNFLLIEQALLRYAGVRWSMPEYMISGDAGNNNYASILEAGTPFVNSREAEQAYYVSRFKRIAWKVLQIAFDAGFFSRFGIDWATLCRLVKVTITAPDIKSKREAEQENIRKLHHDAGILSKRTWQEKAGYDPDLEAERGAGSQAQPTPTTEGGQPPGPSTVLADKNLLTNRRVGKRTAEIGAELADGKMTPAVAKAQLRNLGYAEGDVEEILAEVAESKANPILQAAITGALESVETTDEARRILETVREAYP